MPNHEKITAVSSRFIISRRRNRVLSANVIRALAPVLACPITKVRKVWKREIIFYEEAVMPAPLESAEHEERKIIPFPVQERLPAQVAATDGDGVILPFPYVLAEAASIGATNRRAFRRGTAFSRTRSPPRGSVYELR